MEADKPFAVSKPLFVILPFSSPFNIKMPLQLSAKAGSEQQDYSQELMSCLVVAMFPEEMALINMHTRGYKHACICSANLCNVICHSV